MGTLPKLESFEITHFFDEQVHFFDETIDLSDDKVDLSNDNPIFFNLCSGGPGRSGEVKGRSLEVPRGVCNLKYVKFELQMIVVL